MAAMMKPAATQSVQPGTSCTSNAAETVPTSGTAISAKVLACGGRLRARPNQITCATP